MMIDEEAELRMVNLEIENMKLKEQVRQLKIKEEIALNFYKEAMDRAERDEAAIAEMCENKVDYNVFEFDLGQISGESRSVIEKIISEDD